MSAKFEILKATNGQFYFRLKATNGEIILASEQYVAKNKAEEGIASVKVNAPKDASYERKASQSGQPYFVLKAANTEPLGRSEMYNSKEAMETGITSVKNNAPSASVEDLSK